MICLYAGVASARTEEDQSLASNSSGPTGAFYDQCFHRPASDCPPNDPEVCPCKWIPNDNALLCCNVNNVTLERGLSCAGKYRRTIFTYLIYSIYLLRLLCLFSGTNNTAIRIHIRNATMDNFWADDKRWRQLESLAITDGHIKYVKHQFRIMTPLVCLNLSNNELLEMSNNSLNRLTRLTTLDLSNNNLTDLPNLNTINDRTFWLDIVGKLSLDSFIKLKNIRLTLFSSFYRNADTVVSKYIRVYQ